MDSDKYNPADLFDPGFKRLVLIEIDLGRSGLVWFGLVHESLPSTFDLAIWILVTIN